MGTVDQGLLLTPGDLWGPFGLLVVLVGVPLVLWTAVNPRRFWLLLLSAAIVGVGPRIRGYMVLDEAALFCALVGAFLHLMIKRRQKHHPEAGFGHVLFLVWTIYMVLQAITGIVVNQDLRIARWLLFYTMIGCACALARNTRTFPFPPLRQACIVILVSTLLSYVVYLGQGMYYEADLGSHGRFLSQDYVWAGSAYAVFPTLLAVPAAVFLSGDGSRAVRALVWSTLFVSLLVGFYFDSRISWVTFGGYAALLGMTRLVKMRHLSTAGLLFGVLFVTYMPDPRQNITEFVEDFVKTSQALWNPSKSDVGRNLQFKAGWMTLTQDVKTFAVGTGVYSHRSAIVPVITRLFNEFLPEQDFIIAGSRNDSDVGITIFRTTGFTATLLDTGVVGTLLFIAVYVRCAYTVLRRGGRHRYLLVMTVIMGFCWLLVSNILDIVLLYLLVMPGGVVERLDLGATSELARRSEARAQARRCCPGTTALVGARG